MRCHLINIISLVFLLPFMLHAQEVTPDSELDFIIEEFTLPGGQAGNNVNAIVQGPYGFMWFGSHGGLHRYDGYEFITYRNVPSDTVAETTTLSFSYVEWLYWDRYDKLWVTTYGGGLFRFDPVTETFRHYAHDPEDSTTVSHPRVLCAIEDASGQMWFGTEQGLNRFDRETETFTRYFADTDNHEALWDDDVRSFYVDREGTLWIGTGFAWFQPTGGALSKYNPATDSFENYTPDNKRDLPHSAVRGML